MKTIGVTAALLILGVMLITPAAFADGDDGGNVFFGITVGPPAGFYGPPPVIYVRPQPRVIWPPDADGDRYRYHRYDRDHRYRGYRDNEDRDHYEHYHWRADDHWHHRWRDDDRQDDH